MTLVLTQQIVQLFIIMLMGYAAAKAGVVGSRAGKAISAPGLNADDRHHTGRDRSEKTIAGKKLWLTAVLKMVVLPAVIILIMKYCGMTRLLPDAEIVVFIGILATMTPAAATVTQMAQLYDNDVQQATFINALTTLMCVITMPLMTALYYM